MTAVTPRMLDTVRAVRDHHAETGCWPDIRTVAQLLGLSSGQAHSRLLGAAKAGVLVRDGERGTRSPYRLPLGDPCPSCGQRVPIEPWVVRGRVIHHIDPASSGDE